MSNERLNIPKQLKIGYQERKDTFSGKLAYVTYIDKKGKDYRYQEKQHPVEALRDRTCDNTEIGRKQ